MIKQVSKKKIAIYIISLIVLALNVGIWAYFTSTNSLDNQLQTKKYGTELVEEFTPKDDWQPGQTLDKKVAIKNTGDYDLLVRVRMSEVWTFGNMDGFAVTTCQSWNPFFFAATKEKSVHVQVVYKEFTGVGTGPNEWTFNQDDGYWYYNSKLKPGERTSNLLNSITLCGDAELGKFEVTKYYTKAKVRPDNDNIGSDAATQWVKYSGPVPQDATFSRSASTLQHGDLSFLLAWYNLHIFSETLQATQEAFSAASQWDYVLPKSSWSGAPNSVKAAWGVL